MDLSIYLRYYSAAGIYFSFRWGPFVHSLEIVQWDSTRRDHPGNLGGVSGSGPVNTVFIVKSNVYFNNSSILVASPIQVYQLSTPCYFIPS